MTDDLTRTTWAQLTGQVTIPTQTSGGGVASSVTITGTVPVTATAMPLPSGAAQDGTDATGVTPPSGATGIRGWLSSIYNRLGGTLTTARTWVLSSTTDSVNVGNFPTTQAVSGTFWPSTQPVSGSVSVSNLPATQPVSGSVSVSNFPATQPVSLATNTPDVTDRSARLLGHVTIDSGAVAVTQQALTKGTQGANGVTTQDLKDAGRTAVVLSVTAAASIVTETVFTLNIWKAGVASTATSYTVTAGKTFRLQAVQFGCRFATPSTTVTFANARFNIRSGNLVTSPLVYGDSKMAASNTPTPNSDLPIEDGLEFPAGTVLSVWHADSATTLLLDVVLVGFEY